MVLNVNKIVFSNAFNILLFNAIWFGCVVGQGNYLWLIGPVLCCYVVLMLRAGRFSLLQLLLPIAIGVSVDLLLTQNGFYQFDNQLLLIPLWLVILWVAFSTTLTQSLRFLGKNIYLAALLGAIGFPFSYAMGERLGAVSFGDQFFRVMVMLCVIWAVLLPCIYRWIDRPARAIDETA